MLKWFLLFLFLVTLAGLVLAVVFLGINKKKLNECSDKGDEMTRRLTECCKRASGGRQEYCEGYGTERPEFEAPWQQRGKASRSVVNDEEEEEFANTSME